MNIAERLKKRIEDEKWQPLSLENDNYQLDLPEVHGMDEVGFVFWYKPAGGDPQLIASGHTLRGLLVDAEERPLDLTDGQQQVITSLLEQ